MLVGFEMNSRELMDELEEKAHIVLSDVKSGKVLQIREIVDVEEAISLTDEDKGEYLKNLLGVSEAMDVDVAKIRAKPFLDSNLKSGYVLTGGRHRGQVFYGNPIYYSPPVYVNPPVYTLPYMPVQPAPIYTPPPVYVAPAPIIRYDVYYPPSYYAPPGFYIYR
jgi:hypothetical protein